MEDKQEIYSRMLEYIGEAFYRTDAETRLVMVGGAAARLIGCDSAEELIGLPIEALLYWPEDQPKFMEAIGAQGSVTDYELTLRKKDGSPLYIEVSSHFYHDEQGNVLGIEGIVRDISERKAAETALRESESKYRGIFEASFNPIFLFDLETGRTLDASQAACKAYGYRREEILQVTCLDLSAEPEKSASVLAQKRDRVSMRYHKRKDGSIFPVDIQVSYIQLDGRNCVLASVQDVTHRLEAEAALKESESKYRMVFEETGVPYVLADARTRLVLDANRAFQEQYGYSLPELLQMRCEDISAEPEATAKAIDDRQAHVPLRYHKRKDGSVFPVEIYISTYVWQGRDVFIASVRDISASVNAIRALEESESKYRAIFESTGSPYAMMDLETGRIIDVNEAGCRQYGYTREEVLQLTFLDFSAEPDASTGGFKGRVPYVPLRYHKRKNGEVFPVEGYLSYVNWQGRDVVIISLRDITERMAAEKALAESEERYRTMFEETGIPFRLVDFETGVILDVNQACAVQYGYTREEMLGMRYFDLSADPEATRQSFDSGNLHVPLRYHMRKDGSAFPVEIHAATCKVRGRLCHIASPRDISSRLAAEDALRQSESTYRSLYELAPNPLFLVDKESSRILDVNEATCRVYGYSREELLQMRNYEVSAEPDRSKVALEEGATYIPLRYHKRKDGSVFPVEMNISYFERNGRVVCHNMAMDITERLAVQKALAESEARYRGIVDSQRDIVLRLDLNFRVHFANDAWRRIIGIDIDESGINLRRDAFHPDDYVVMDEHNANLMQPPHRVYSELRLKTLEGWRWYGFESYVIHDADGNVAELQTVAHDVHDRRLAEEELAAHARRLSMATEAAREGIWEVNLQTNEVYLSPQMYALVGSTPEEYGDGYMDAVHPDDVEPVVRHIEDHIAGLSDKVDIEFRILRKPAELRWAHGRGRITRTDEQGRPLAIGGTVTDVTEAHMAFEALEKALADLKRAYDAQKEFLNCVRHEIRTPLITVKGYADMLLEGLGGPLTEEQIQYLKKVQTSSDSLLHGVSAMLEMSRLRSGKVDVAYEIFSPFRLVSKLASALTPLAHQKGLNIEVHDCGCEGSGVTDSTKFSVIFNNLLSNAIKFTDKGGVDIYVDSDESGFTVAVVDTGKGMPESQMGDIFEEFTQLQSASKYKENGFGIGLSLSAALVDLLKAGLAVSTRKGVGTAFTLRIPKLDPEAAG